MRALDLARAALNATPTMSQALLHMAEYAASLEQALGGSMQTPWPNPSQGTRGSRAPAHPSNDSTAGAPPFYTLRAQLRHLANYYPNDVQLGLVCSIASNDLIQGLVHDAFETLYAADDERLAPVQSAVLKEIVSAMERRVGLRS